jgi:hypothetical protein
VKDGRCATARGEVDAALAHDTAARAARRPEKANLEVALGPAVPTADAQEGVAAAAEDSTRVAHTNGPHREGFEWVNGTGELPSHLREEEVLEEGVVAAGSEGAAAAEEATEESQGVREVEEEADASAMAAVASATAAAETEAEIATSVV